MPHFNVFDMFTSQGWKLKVTFLELRSFVQRETAFLFFLKQQSKLYGAIVHGEFSAAYVYPDYQEGGSNVTIEVVDRTLKAYSNGDATTGHLPKKLPPTMYLQLDNTVKLVASCDIFIMTRLCSLFSI